MGVSARGYVTGGMLAVGKCPGGNWPVTILYKFTLYKLSDNIFRGLS